MTSSSLAAPAAATGNVPTESAKMNARSVWNVFMIFGTTLMWWHRRCEARNQLVASSPVATHALFGLGFRAAPTTGTGRSGALRALAHRTLPSYTITLSPAATGRTGRLAARRPELPEATPAGSNGHAGTARMIWRAHADQSPVSTLRTRHRPVFLHAANTINQGDLPYRPNVEHIHPYQRGRKWDSG